MWHFRLVVPADLHATFGLRIIKRSLHTRDPDQARAYAYAWGARYADLFAAARRGEAMADWLKKLTVPGLRDALHEPTSAPRQKGEPVREFTADVRRGIYKTDGTPGDAEALTAFVKAMQGHTAQVALPVALSWSNSRGHLDRG
ncbi:DUF6538 domain-containing protein [Xanthomonas hyacinthi]|nr:DUF6538 domain-containing protein [Xanthomonas hyacinthi]